MAQTILQVGAAVVDYYYFGGAPVASTVVAYGIGQHNIANTQIEGFRLQDLRLPTFEYGSSIPRAWGGIRIPGIPIWMSSKREIRTTTGGKGGAEPESVTYTYEVDILFLLLDNPIAAVPRVWSNGELVYNVNAIADQATMAASMSQGIWTDMRVYTGDPAQLPDPIYEAAVGAGNAPAYRHRGTVMIEGLQLGNSGQLPMLNFEALTNATVAPPLCIELDPQEAHYWTGGELPSDSTQDVFVSGPDVEVIATYYETGSGGFCTGGYIRTEQSVSGCKRYFEFLMLDTSSAAGEVWAVFVFDGDGNSRKVIGQSTPGTADNLLSFVIDAENGKVWFRTSANGDWVPPPPDIGSPGPHDPELGLGGGTLGLTGQDMYIQFVVYGLVAYTRLEANLRTTAAQFTGSMPASCIPWTSLGVDVEMVTPGTVYLDEVVSDLCTESGLAPSQIDVTDLAGVVIHGVPITNTSPARSTLQALAGIYHFECTESEVLRFQRRGGAVASTIEFEDLGAAANDEADSANPLTPDRGNDLEVPAKIALRYLNLDNDYQSGTVFSDRLVGESIEAKPVSAPAVLQPPEAQVLAERLVLDARVSATSIKAAINDLKPRLEPTDVVSLVDEDGTTYRARIVRDTFSDGARALECILDDASVFSQPGITTEFSPSITVVRLAPTVLELLDIPILRDADDSAGIYAAVRAGTGRWPGAAIFGSRDGTTFDDEGTVTRQATMGETSGALGDWTGGNVFDELNAITVVLDSGSLSSSTSDLLVSDDVNAALIGSEIVQFRTATLIATDTYTLTGLLRGRRGTEWAMSDHIATERFVLLDDQGILRVGHASTDINVLKYWRAVTMGKALSSVASEEFTDTGIALKPFSVQDIRFTPDSSQNLVLTWKRRSRLAYQFLPSVVPLGEDTERYRVTIEATGSPVVLLRTEVVNSASKTYTRAQQIADGVDPSTELLVTVTQLSAIVGDGYPASGLGFGVANALAQIIEIELGGVFEDGQLIRAVLGAETFNYTTVTSSSLAAAATALAALIDASSNYSAVAIAEAVQVTGPVSTAYAYSARIVPGDNAASFVVTQAATPAAPARGYSAYVSIGSATSPGEPIPAFTTLGATVYQGASYIGNAAYSSPSAETYAQALSGLATAFATVELSSAGYSMTTTTLNGSIVGFITGPLGISNTSISTAASGGYSVVISVIDQGAAAVPADLPQIVDVTLSGTPATDWVYRITLDGTPFEYTALVTDTMTTIATELATLIDASANYIATSAGPVVTIERSVAAVAFSYAAEIISGDVTVAVDLLQEAI